MNKTFKQFGIIWLICFILFNAIIFLIPNEVFGLTRFDKPAFWISYVLVLLAFAAQLLIAYKFVKDENKDKLFLNIPLIKTGYLAVVVCSIVGLIFMIFPILPAWLGAIICLLIAGYFAIACLKASATANAIAQIDTKIKTQTAFIRLAIVDAESILSRATTPEIKEKAKQVYEELRYSDPMSNPALDSIEQEIDALLKKIKTSRCRKQPNSTSAITTELLVQISDRNKKCKALK